MKALKPYGSKSLKKLEVSDVQLNAFPSPGGEYQPVVPRDLMSKLFKKTSGLTEFLSSLLAVVIMSTGCLYFSETFLFSFSTPGEELPALGVYAGVLLLSSIPGVYFFKRENKFEPVLQRLNEPNEVAFSTWLKDRYGIEVVMEQRHDHYKLTYVAAGLSGLENHVFTAKDGRRFQVRRVREDDPESGMYVLELKDDIETIEHERSTKLSKGDSLFVGELATLWSSLDKRLQIAEQSSMRTPEKRHIIERVKQDMENVVDSVTRLMDLNIQDNKQAGSAVEEILSNLNEEVQKAIDLEGDEVVKDLQVQSEWVRSRKTAQPGLLNATIKHEMLILKESAEIE